jgi:hypothetical protein
MKPFTDASAKAMVAAPQDRSGTARTLVESFGGKQTNTIYARQQCEYLDGVTTSAAPASSPAADHIWLRVGRESNAWRDWDNSRSGRREDQSASRFRAWPVAERQ